MCCGLPAHVPTVSHAHNNTFDATSYRMRFGYSCVYIYWLCSVGRMTYEECLQRGAVDRSWKLEKLSFHRDSGYNTVNKICQEATWPEKEDGVEFYIADGSGVSIEKEKLEVLSDDGKKNFVSWTLSNYLTH